MTIAKRIATNLAATRFEQTKPLASPGGARTVACELPDGVFFDSLSFAEFDLDGNASLDFEEYAVCRLLPHAAPSPKANKPAKTQ